MSMYQRSNVTPYIHALMNHVGEFLKIHRSILPFTHQGLEKKNDVLTKAYFHSSNHQGEVAPRQILEKQNRIEHLETIASYPGSNYAGVEKRAWYLPFAVA